MHVVLFGVFLAISAKVSPWIALLFATEPTLKAVASVHGTDSDAAVFISMALLFALISFGSHDLRGSKVLLRCLGIGALLGLSASAKLSSIWFFPLVVGVQLVGARSIAGGLRVLGATFGGAVIGLWVGFRGDPQFLEKWLSLFQNGSMLFDPDRITFLRGRFYRGGTWSYFVEMWLYKTPVVMMALFIFGALALVKNRSKIWPAFIFPLGFVILFSWGSLQIGYRHMVPAICVAIVLGTYGLSLWGRTLAFKAFSLIALVLIGNDLYALTQTTYLGYSNVLAPYPPTRNIADSSLDWAQGMAAPVRARKIGKDPILFGDLTGFTRALYELHYEPEKWKAEGVELVRFSAGATALSGLWSETAPLLKMFPPQWVLGGYEVHDLSREQVLRLLAFSRDKTHQWSGKDPQENFDVLSRVKFSALKIFWFKDDLEFNRVWFGSLRDQCRAWPHGIFYLGEYERESTSYLGAPEKLTCPSLKYPPKRGPPVAIDPEVAPKFKAGYALFISYE